MNYNNPNPYNSYASPLQSTQSQSPLLQKVSYLLCTALLVTAGGAYLSRDWDGGLWIAFAIGTFVCVFALQAARNNPTLSLFLLYALSLMEGLMLGPVLANIVRYFPGGGMIVAESVALSGIIIAGVGSYVWISNKDFGGIGKYLMFGLIGVLIVSVISMFWHSLAVMGSFQLIISLAIVALFVGFALYDFSNIKNRYSPNDYVIATVALYLDFLNLFMAILRILMILASGGNSRRN